MARIAEESDDGLPSLEDLTKNEDRSKGRKTVSRNGVVVSTNKTSFMRGGNEGRNEEKNFGRKERGDREVKKMRVLNQVADNPLLRPLKVEKMRFECLGEKETSRKGETLREMSRERDGGVRQRLMSRSKSRSVTPAEELISNDDGMAEKPKPRSTIVGDGKMIISGKSKFSSKMRSQDVSSLKETAVAGTNQGAKSKTRKIADLKPSKRLVVESEPEPDEYYDSDGLSDFVVDDSSFLESEDSVMNIPPPAPRSCRKLVQGRKIKGGEESDGEDLDLEMKKLNIRDNALAQESRGVSKEKELEAFAKDSSDNDEDSPTNKRIPRKLFEDVRMEPPRRTKEASPTKKFEPASSDIEDPFTLR